MKMLINKIKNTVDAFAVKTKLSLANTRGEGYIDTAVKVIISLIIGGCLLAGLYALFNDVVIPNMGDKIGEMFNYAG